LKKYESPGSDQILAKLIQAGCDTLLPEAHTFIYSIWNKEELSDQWKDSVILPKKKKVYKKGDKSDCSNYYGISLLSAS
jgi:hypothetical protein